MTEQCLLVLLVSKHEMSEKFVLQQEARDSPAESLEPVESLDEHLLLVAL